MKVLITGATGFVGRAVCEAVVREGHSVRRLARGNRPQALDTPDGGMDSVRGSVLCPEDLRRALHGCDAVIHLVGIIGEIGDQTFERVHQEGTLRVVEAALACGVRRIVHMSALGTRPSATSRYHQTKWAAEEAVRASGLDWTIFRPSVIYGPGDGFVNLFARMSRWSPVLPVIGQGTALLQPVSVDGVAQAFARALDSKNAVHQTYDLCGPDRLTMSQVLQAILRATRRRRLMVRIPGWLAWYPTAVLEQVFPRILRRPAPLSRDQILMLEEDNVGNPSAAESDFQIRSKPFLEGIGAFLDGADGLVSSL
jgi:NADH dehydrogenase